MIKPRFTPDINLGHLLQAVVVIGSIAVGYGTLQSRITGVETRLDVVERAIKERRAEEREFSTEMRAALADIQRILTDIRVQAATRAGTVR
jgi:hypothetical protein